MDEFPIPQRLAESCRGEAKRLDWLATLPETVRELATRWSLRLGDPFEADATCAWVAPAARSDGGSVVLKLGMPHMEGVHEIAGLRFWSGEPTVRLLDADEERNAILLERCSPGSSLRELPEAEQDEWIGELLPRIWRKPPEGHPFRPLSEMTAGWKREAEKERTGWPDAGLAREALSLLDDLTRSASSDVLLATDLHAGNVLRAERQPWLVIDPKPFVGDPAYDATQHLLNCPERLAPGPLALVERFAGLLGLDGARVRRWMFARVVLHPARREPDHWLAVARALSH